MIQHSVRQLFIECVRGGDMLLGPWDTSVNKRQTVSSPGELAPSGANRTMKETKCTINKKSYIALKDKYYGGEAE